MIPPNHPSERESLSALFDGELHGDASRFAHKRLAQDVQWRQACGTWQLVGDVLRGHATAAAPADFADRVRLALAHGEAAAEGATPRAGRRWVGGAALAASVAIAAWFVASPLDEAAPAMPATTVATAPAPRAATAPAVVAPSASARPSPAQGDTAVTVSRSPVVAMAAAAPSPASPSALAVPPVPPVAGEGLLALEATALADPFQLPDPPPPRPWPRAVLPDYPVSGALTAGYGVPPQNSGAVASGAPGFYPFEPRLPAEAEADSDAQKP